MTNNLKYAKEKLLTKQYTLVLYNGSSVVTSKERGIKPLLDLYKNGGNFEGFCAADKVIGKAAAFLYVLLGIKEIYALAVSRVALEVLKNNCVKIIYEECSEYIINRTATDICPMEKSVLDISEPNEAYTVICEKLNSMK